MIFINLIQVIPQLKSIFDLQRRRTPNNKKTNQYYLKKILIFLPTFVRLIADTVRQENGSFQNMIVNVNVININFTMWISPYFGHSC